jgi:hypothetical protein
MINLIELSLLNHLLEWGLVQGKVRLKLVRISLDQEIMMVITI